MTKRHFQALADALKEEKPESSGFDALNYRDAQWRKDVYAIAHTCAQFNPWFELAVFLTACGLESD